MTKSYTMKEITTMYETGEPLLPASTGVLEFVLHHNLETIEPIVDEFLEKKQEIIDKYATVDENGHKVMTDENVTKANAELKPYLDIKYDLDIIVVPEVKLLNCGLKAVEMRNIKWMIERSTADDIRSMLGIVDKEAEEAAKKEASKYDPSEPVDDDRFV